MTSDSEDEEQMIEVLPDVIKGWLLLEKAGLDSLERSIIQSDIKSRFTLLGVENSLRAHWTDDQVKRRDEGGKHHAHFEDWDEDEDAPPQPFDADYFDDWSEEDMVLYQSAQAEEAQAWAQIQDGRRTLKAARERQKEVRLNRKFFPSKGRGKSGVGKHPGGSSSSARAEGPCLRCGKAHATRMCPQRNESEEKGTFQADASAEFIYYAETLFGEHQNPEEAMAANGNMKMSTQEAMKAGFGVLDPGATRTMGSITALEHARAVCLQQHRQDNVAAINVDERPVFAFADSETAKCSSTILLSLPVAEQRMKLRVHALDKGSVPVLLSIDTLKPMRAIVDYGRDEVVFVGINPQKCVKLSTTSTGHQILPLTQDFMKEARDLQAPVHRLGCLRSE